MKVHSLTLSYIPESMRCDFWALFLARTFVNPCLGHKPKATVATFMVWEHCFEATSLSTSIIVVATSCIFGDKVETSLKVVKGVHPIVFVSPRHP